MNRNTRRQQQNDKIDRFLMDRTMSVNISKDREGRWQVRCHDSRGYYIGGCSSMSGLDEARALGHRYLRVFD